MTGTETLTPEHKIYLKKHHQPYYFYKTAGCIRIEFWDTKKNKKVQYQRSISKYGVPLAKQELFKQYKKITGSNKVFKTSSEKKQEKETAKMITYKHMDDLPIEKWFKLPDKNQARTVLVIGRSGSGKTYFLAELFERHLKHIYDYYCLMTPSLINPIYKKFKQTAKLAHYNPNFIKHIWTYQKHSNCRHAPLLILDDIDKGDRSKDQDFMNKMFLRFRNLRISTIVSTQFPSLISPAVRENAHLIILGHTGHERIDWVIDMLSPYLSTEYDSQHANKTRIINWYREKTQDHKFIILDNVENKLYYHK
jgi:DNA replication protein DnaC